MKTVLVTGGCGFIGSHFVRLVSRLGQWRVVNIDKLTYAGHLANVADIEPGSRYRFVEGDITDQVLVGRIFEEEKPWAVVNFAAESHVDRSIIDAVPFLETNVTGVQVLLEAAHRSEVLRFLQVSSDEVYGDAEGKEPFPEESPLHPSSPYSASKAAAELLCGAYMRTHGLPVLVARSSNNYGPYQYPEKLIPLVIRNALSGERIPVYGDGAQKRDWLYVEDNCEALAAVLVRGEPGRTYNIGTAVEHGNLEVVEALCRIVAAETGRSAEELLATIEMVADRPGHDRRYAIDVSAVSGEIKWAANVSLHEGLRRTVRWYLQHRDWVEKVTGRAFEGYYDAVYREGWRQPNAPPHAQGHAAAGRDSG